MQKDEMLFFHACWFYGRRGVSIRDVIGLFDNTIPIKRCWHYLKKWSDRGFYDYDTALDLGWFEFHKIPERYSELLVVEKTKPEIRPVDANYITDYLEYYLTHTSEDGQEHYAYERAMEVVKNAPELNFAIYAEIQRFVAQEVQNEV